MTKIFILIIAIGMAFNVHAQKNNKIFNEADSLYKVGDYFNAYLKFKKAGKFTNHKLCKAYMDTSVMRIDENRIELNQNRTKILELNSIIEINTDSMKVLNKNIAVLRVDKNKINNDLIEQKIKNRSLEEYSLSLKTSINNNEIKIDSISELMLRKDSLLGNKEDLIANKNSIIEDNEDLILKYNVFKGKVVTEFSILMKEIKGISPNTTENKKIINSILEKIEFLEKLFPEFEQDFNLYKQKNNIKTKPLIDIPLTN